MRRTILSLICLMATFGAFSATQSRIEKNTYIYAIKGDADTLRLDKYDDPSLRNESKKPVVMFAFGGSFRSGARDAADYTRYFDFLAGHGYVVISIDYRTGMSEFKSSAGIGAFATDLQKSVSMAVEDLFSATAFTIQNSLEWGVDPEQIIISGSSAGAITVLQAEYAISNASPAVAILPESFNYAGVISFAGAICTTELPAWASSPCPILFFHGDADTVVPFDKATIDDIAGMYGSRFLSKQLSEIGIPHELYIIKGSGHEVATSPMNSNLYDILAFLKEFVEQRQNRITCSEQILPGAPTDYKTDFSIMDYIRANMPQ